ncbi:MarR family winged helix-turn-helix transcriptional regulator [Nocardia sp. NPDC049149]|uniref:MarR family winged helix-turn-helix transcriptional regulator n=1 Tax=Nocardia sp. NPDC049149 TaxID=3364315 RepID=UPI00371F87F4
MQHAQVTTADDLIVDLLVTAGRLTRLAGVISRDDLPRAVLRALAVLDEHGAVRVSEFARIDRCSQPAATTLIGRLVADGFATRRKDTEDSRAVVVELTQAGRNRLTQARKAFAAALTTRLDSFDTARLAQLDTDLNELLDALKTATRQPHSVTEPEAVTVGE